MKKIAFQTLFIALCVIFLFAGCAVRETPVDSVVSSLTASEGTSEPTATDGTPEASEPTRTIVFDTPTTIRADWVIAEGAAPIREYSDAFSLLPVYVDAYPSMQAGRLYTYDAAYRRASAAWITDFMQIWQGSAPAATAMTEDGANSVLTFVSAELSASPSRLLVVVMRSAFCKMMWLRRCCGFAALPTLHASCGRQTTVTAANTESCRKIRWRPCGILSAAFPM